MDWNHQKVQFEQILPTFHLAQTATATKQLLDWVGEAKTKNLNLQFVQSIIKVWPEDVEFPAWMLQPYISGAVTVQSECGNM